jgi:hypothetical protein
MRIGETPLAVQEVIHAGEKNELLIQMEQEIRDPQARALGTPGDKKTGPTAMKEINGLIKIVLLRIAKIEHRTSQLEIVCLTREPDRSVWSGQVLGIGGSKALKLCARVVARVVRDTNIRRLWPEVTAISDRIITSIGCRSCDSHSPSKSGKCRAFLIGDVRRGIMRKNGIQSRNTTKLNRYSCRNSNSAAITGENT